MQSRWQYLFGEAHTTSSRSQKGGQCKQVVLRTPIPPNPMGRVAWVQAKLSIYIYIYIFFFENLCVARCRHDYRLRTSLAEEIKGQMSIVTVFTRRFGPI